MDILLTVDGLKKSFGVHDIFQNVSFTLRQGEKVGLVGVNGSGKTTLLRCLLNPDFADGGSVKFAGELRLGYVEQGFDDFREETVREFMEHACPDILDLREKMRRLEEASGRAQGEELQGILDQYARTESRYAHLDGYHYESNIKRVLLGLGYPEDTWQWRADKLSGGQKTRLQLAAALVNSPDLLILDEPTNHLDIVMSEWLEKYLREFRGGVLVISHDRAFLDNVVEEILEMEGGTIHRFKGNYSRYLEQKEIQVLTQTRAYEAQQEYIARQEAYIRRFKAGIKSKMARGRQSQLDRLERIDAPVQEEEFELRLPPAAECAEKVIMLEHLDVGYPQHRLLQDVDLTLRRGEKVAIIGPNGCGKSTLLKTILQELPPLKGEARVGNRVKIGYFSQSYERLDEKQTIMENFLTEYGMTDEQTRRLLGSMMFHGEDVFKVIGTLSGGQKARLVLLKLVLDGANCLLLDEPTNHLDIAAKEAVEAALETFDGTVLLVSHDRYLVNEVAGRIWAVENGHVTDYKGNYDFYLEERDKNRAREGADAPAAPRKEEKKAAKPAPEKTAPEAAKTEKKTEKKPYSPAEAQKLLPQVELKIREYEALQKVLSDRIADPANQQDLETSTRLAEEYAEQEKILDGLMDKWEKLMESLE
ncbi:ABC transporter ATP-binding protein [Acidaminococcus fermentans]|uniref:ABC transporter ATP-binding protein n=2 Tax=Acidaminococcus fermentans TaxID=905 RepID=UPI002432BF26|nr:ATP-binding cassette domain-containing protein [Acidaminococcus fermentans]MCF0139945.1 ATP-binding cassette domain-containing protein [Acidaminococcus fermentans]MCI6285900.1 ATP-binding cassette domain-containing protein [Acidaminococcus fermentans]MCI7193848.1 ATP-binding cassette domain-containing protein [Acidaminococcus fermentans]MDD6288490.1 ATP-binding cassette domain-containing protein [Acidaminococcus fermentans]